MVAIRSTSLFFISAALLSSYVHAYGQIAQVVDATNFCVFLPPDDDTTDRLISDVEWEAQAFCLGSTPSATNAGTLPSGFIRSAHYVATDKYVQVTGQIDPTKANLNPTDQGGQMDYKAPTGSSCAGWKYYVNIIEPANLTYCMRCCNDTVTCNRGISQDGCAHVIPGDYSGPMNPSLGNSNEADNTNSGSASSASTSAAAVESITTAKEAITTAKTEAEQTTTTGTTKTDEGTKTEKATAVVPTTTSAPAATTTKPAAAATTTATTDSSSSDANTVPKAVSIKPSSSSSAAVAAIATPNSDLVSESSASSTSAAVAASSPSPSSKLLGENEQITSQSVSGAAETFKPSMIALAITLIAMATMN